MNRLTINTTATAPDASRDILQAIEDGLGFVPNVYGVFANAPAALKGLAALNTAFGETSFSPAECEIIALATSVHNQCPYCVAGHSTFALHHGVDRETVNAVRNGGVSDDPKLQALGQITFRILETKGALSPADMRAFLNADYRTSQVLELLIGIAGKTMTNFAAKILHLPLDDEFADQAWSSDSAPESNAA
ncbi:MAG: carboxymuconolactone decarboxylase family protein [Hyphomonas sp.]|nr:carboxymuconolactone decarboxylase family protein [Hyphomonas sp.]